jgi:hypothetical protein
MLVYWSLYAVPAFAALYARPWRNRNSLHPFFLIFLYLFLVMAFRETGGDFYTYSLLIERFSGENLTKWLLLTDPAYGFLNWLSIQAGWGIYGVNFFCSVIFLFGLYRFALGEPRPFLLVAIAIPYFVIVVAIGYTRQGTAAGLLMLALTYIRRGSVLKATGSIILATSFHSTVLIAGPLLYYALAKRRNLKFILIPLLLASLYGGYQALVGRFDNMMAAYIISDHYQSSGAVQRTFITAAAAVLFFLYRKRWKYLFDDWHMYFYVAVVSVALFPFSFFQSTAADRIGLFLLPFQVLVFARLPVLQSNKSMMHLATVGVLVAYTLVLFVWLHLGQFSQRLWLPYSNLLLGALP